MCGSKGSTVSSTSGPPQEFLKAYGDVYGQASGLTQQPYQAYGGPMIAGFSPDQLAAFGTFQNSQGLAQPYFNQAASYYQNAAMPITPMGFDNVDLLPSLGLSYFDWAGQQAGQAAAPISLMDYDISPYQNQYTSDVTNSLSDLYAQNNAEQFSQLRGNAASQGAFGGDRDAILTAETARQQKLAQDPTLAQIQQQGFAQAQEEFNKQQLADYQRQVAQKQYALGAGQLGMGIGSGLWGEYNTQQAQNTQAQEASAYLQNYAGTNFATLGMQAQNSALQGAQAQLGIGAQQQQMAQQQLNVPYYQFMQQQAYPYQQLGWLSNIATGLGGASGGNSSTTYPGPSTIGQIAGLGTAGLGIAGQFGAFGGGSSGGYGYGSSPNYSGQGGDFWDLTGMSGWGGADGGAVPHRAPGGSVELGVPPEFGGSGIPGMESYIPGAHGLGSEPASKEGSGLSKMFMQPVTTQTQQQSGGGGLGQILGLGVKAAGLFLDDGGAVPSGVPSGVPRGTGLAGYAEGGMPIHSAAPIISDLTHVMAPSDGPKPTEESLMPRINYAPSFDAQGYPGALTGIPRGTPVPPPLSIPMSHGMMNRAALGAPPPMLSPAMGPGQDFGLSMPPPPTFPPEWGQTSEGNADGGRIGYDDGGSVTPPLGMQDPATALAEKIKRIQDMERLRLQDNWPSFQRLLSQQPKADGGSATMGLAGYIPAAPQFGNGMGPPKPPSMQGWKPENGNDSIMSLLTSAKSFLGELNKESAALGGAVEPTATPLQFDEGGAVSGMMGGLGSMGGGGMQQRALLQQYQNMPTEKLREMAMRYPPTTPQGAALQRALQMRQMNPASAAPSTATGPTGPYGPSGQVTPGTTAARGGGMGLAEGGPVPITPRSGDFNIQRILDEMRAQGNSMQVGDAVGASDRMRRELQRRIHPGFDGGGGIKDDDWIEPPPRDWVPPLIIEPPPKPSRPKDERYYGGLAGFADGGEPEFGPDLRDVMVLAPNDISGVVEQPSGGLALPPPRPRFPPDGTTKYNSRGQPYLAEAPGGMPDGVRLSPEAAAEQNAVDPDKGQHLPAMPSDYVFGKGLGAPVGAGQAPQVASAPGGTNGIVPRGTLTPASSSPGRDQVVSFWVNNGAPQHVAEGIADRVNAESGFNPGIMGDNGTSGGGYQHHADRLAALKNFAAQQGKDWRDLALQNQFSLTEVQGGDPIAAAHWDEIRNAPDRQTASTLWDKYFERSKYGPGSGRAGGQGLAGGPDAVLKQVGFRTDPSTGQGLAATPASYTSPLREKEKSDLQKMMSSPWMALIGAGAGMMASRSPYPGVAIGEGLQTGLKLAGSMADRENKEDLTQLRAQSTDNQSKHLADMAEQARARSQETSTHNATTESLRAQALAQQESAAQARLLMQQSTLAAQGAALDEKTRHNTATEQDHARQREIQEQLAETRKKLAEIQENKAEPRFGPGPDPKDPSKQVQGTWFYPKSPDPNAENGGVRFVPYVGTAKETAHGSHESAISDIMKTDGVTRLEAEGKLSAAKRDPNSFRARFASQIGTEYGRLLKAWTDNPMTMAKPPPQNKLRAEAEASVRQRYGVDVPGAPSGHAAPASGAPAPSAAPAVEAPKEHIQNGWRYTPDGKPIGPVQ